MKESILQKKLLFFMPVMRNKSLKKFALTLSAIICLLVSVSAQNRTITGTVTDENGAPVEGASVRVKGARTGTAADVNGRYTITVPAGATLVVSGVGLTPREIAVGNQSSVDVAVSRNIGVEETVVVTALGIRRSEKSVGYAVSKVDPNSVLQKSEPDLLKGLQGKVPGVDIRTSQGTPGAATRIQIRGISSFGLETQPLIVVDGVPYSNTSLSTSEALGTTQATAGGAYGSGLANLDPNDIESFNILKGAAASALYGSRASRGVVLITTKSGSGKKGAKALNVNFKTGLSTETISNLPQFQNSYGAGANFRVQAANGSWGGRFNSGNIYDGSGNVIGTSASGVDSIPGTMWGTYFKEYPELFPNGRTAYKAYPNNVKDLFNTGKLFENSIGINGGNEGATFGATLSNVHHLGYVENSSYNRNNISIGGQTKAGGLTLGGNVAFTNSKQIGGFFGVAQSFVTQWGRSLIMARNWDIANFPTTNRAGNQQIGFNDNQYTNPIWAAYHNTITTRENRVVANFRANYKVNNLLSFSYTIGVNDAGIFRDQIIDESSYGTTNGTPNAVGHITEDNFREQELQSTIMAIFTPKIGNTFTLDFKLGNAINHQTGRRQANLGSDFIVPNLYSITNTNTKTFLQDYRSKRRIVGFFGDATLGFKNFAFLNLTGRNDRSSTLPVENASYWYYGVSGSLVWTDALKIKNNWLDYGKIRAGYAKVGNDANPHAGDIFTIATQSFLGQPRATRGVTTYDPELTPEFTTELELGTDFHLFKRRLSGELTWYDKRSTDLIYPINVPVTTGYTSYYTNIGEISNVGWEAGLTVRPIMGKNFNWEIRGAFTKNENFVEKLVSGLTRDIIGGFNPSPGAYIEPGFPYGYIRGTAPARSDDGQLLIDQTTGWIIEDPNIQYIGNPSPDWKLGITNSFSFKGFSLSALWDMTKGGAFYSETITSLLGRGVTRDTEERRQNWVIEGIYGNSTAVTSADGLQRYVPLLVGGKTVPNQTKMTTNDLFFSGGSGISQSFGINGIESFNVYDGTVYRLREVTLGYELPRSFVQRLKVINGASLTVSGRNLWYKAPNVPKFINYDPEVNSLGSGDIQGFEFSGAPSMRRIGVNLNITF